MNIKDKTHNSNHTNHREKTTGEKVVAFIIGSLLVVFIISLLSSIMSGGNDTEAPVKSDNSATLAKVREDTINKYAPKYCKNHQSTKLTGMSDGYPSNDGSGWTKEECRTIITKLYDIGVGRDDNEFDLVINGNYTIGMSEASLLYSLGNPYDINTTRFENYRSSQYVYGNPIYNAVYIYVEKGKVTSVQN